MREKNKRLGRGYVMGRRGAKEDVCKGLESPERGGQIVNGMFHACVGISILGFLVSSWLGCFARDTMWWCVCMRGNADTCGGREGKTVVRN